MYIINTIAGNGELLAAMIALIAMLISGLCWLFKLAGSVKVIEVQNESFKEKQKNDTADFKSILEKNNTEVKELIISKNNELKDDMHEKIDSLNMNLKANDALTSKLDRDILIIKADLKSKNILNSAEKEEDQLNKLIDALSTQTADKKDIKKK